MSFYRQFKSPIPSLSARIAMLAMSSVAQIRLGEHWGNTMIAGY